MATLDGRTHLPDSQPPTPAPLGGPSSTTWRRQRLLNIGNSDRATSPLESTALRPELMHSVSYGALPGPTRSVGRGKSKLNVRRGFTLPGLSIPRTLSLSTPHTPAEDSPVTSPFHSRFGSQRPISASDPPLDPSTSNLPDEPETAVKVNGIRVWYSSFTSIDWLHDSIKDSARQARLRRGKSRRAKMWRMVDRSIGWLVVSIVGFLTALVAFMIVRSEQWLFDLKTGYCSDGWLKARRFCCPVIDDSAVPLPHFLSFHTDEDFCPAWRLWADVLSPAELGGDWIREQFVEWSAYTTLAVRSALS